MGRDFPSGVMRKLWVKSAAAVDTVKVLDATGLYTLRWFKWQIFYHLYFITALKYLPGPSQLT